MVFLIRTASLLAFALLLQGCTYLIFQPMEQMVRTPADVGIEYRDLQYPVDDGTLLHGWFLPADGKARGTILFLHGNAENISTHLGSVWWLPTEDYNVVLYDYRGYGRSEGTPTLDTMLPDFEVVLRMTRRLPEVQGKPIIVFGQSLGGTVAVSAVARSPQREHIAALIIEGAFSDYRRIARDKLSEFWLTWPFQLPLSFTIDGNFRPLEDIPNISPMPLLVIHGDADNIIPQHHAEALFEAAREPKQFWLIEGAPHIGALIKPEMRSRFTDYLDSIVQQQSNISP